MAEKKKLELKLFVDTMIFLHFRPLGDLDLSALTEFDTVTIIVPRITLHELDKHKSLHASRKIRERAQRVLKELETAISGSAKLKGGIGVEFFASHPKEEIDQLQLNPEWADDILVASVIAYQKATGHETVAVLSQDTGPRLTCYHYGITTFQLANDLALPEDLDETERHNRELQRELMRLKSAQPRLIAAIVGSTEPSHTIKFTLLPFPSVDEDKLDTELAIIRSKYPKKDLPEARTPWESPAMYDSKMISREQWQEYNNQLDEFYREVDGYLRELHDSDEPMSRTISFEIEIRNTGTAPAEDVDTLFHFPDGFRLTSTDDLQSAPEFPAPPKKPLSYMERLAQSVLLPQRLVDLAPDFPSIGKQSSFKIKKTNSYDVSHHFSRIKHGTAKKFPKLYIEFPSLHEVRSFHCDYEIRPANTPDPVRGQLHFVVDVRHP